MKTRLARLAALAAFAIGPQAQALDLRQAWQAAQQQAPESALADAAREGGQARARQAQALWRPNLAVEAGLSYSSAESSTRGAQFSAPGFGTSTGVGFNTSVQGGNATRYAISLHQPLYSPERDAQAQALRLSAGVADSERLQLRQQLMLRTVETYYNVGLAAERLRLLTQQLEAATRAEAEARDRFALGDRPVTEVHEAQARARALTAERVVAESQLQLACDAFTDLTGLPVAPQDVGLPRRLPPAESGDLAGAMALALQANPALRMAEAQLATAQALAQATASQFAPTLDLVGRVARDRIAGSGDFGSAANSGMQRAIGLQLSLPLSTSGMRSAQHAESQAAVQRARAEQARLRLQVSQQTRAVWLELAAGAAQTEALAAALDASRARLDATQVGLKAGDRTTLDLLNAQNDVAGAELTLAQTRARLATRHLELAALAGALDDDALERADARAREHP